MHLKPINQYLSQGTLLSLALLGQNLPLLTSATGSAGPPGVLPALGAVRGCWTLTSHQQG